MDKEDIKYDLPEGFATSTNIANDLDEDILDSLGANLKHQIDTDINSRKEWLERNDKWMELVTQVIEEKTYPWPGAANIKFPLISTAAVQFHARAFPSLLGNSKPVKARIIGRDPNGLKAERAERVSTYMSYQILEGMEGWVDDMDRLLFIVPIIGSLYKKTYYSEVKKKVVSELIHPRDFIINYDAIELKDARKTHRLWKLPNTIKELQNRELYREFDGDDVFLPPQTHSDTKDKIGGLNNPGYQDDYSLQEIFEVHCLLDLDEDGYKEPYICTLRANDGKIYRLVANYSEEDMEMEGERVIAIAPKDYFTHYFFLPDPESKTHGIGFGTMVGPINEAVNTILNQLTDAGHLATLQAGFLSRGIRMKGGAVKFKPGEWKTINNTGDDLKKGIFPLPTKEPSATLFQLLGLLIDAGKDLSSVQDLMVGRNPGQNQPYSTSQMVMEQGMKVFNGIYKRLYRSMSSEFKKIYTLNQKYPDVLTYKNVLDMDGQEIDEAEKAFGPEGVLKFLQADFESSDIDIIPTAEPDMIAEMQKIMRSNSLLEKMAAKLPLNIKEVTKRILEAEGHEDIKSLMEVPKPQPPPDIMLKMAELEHKKQTDGLEGWLKKIVAEADVGKTNMETQLLLLQAQNESTDGLHAQYIKQQEVVAKEFDLVTKRLKVLIDGRKDNQAGASTPKPT